VTLISEEIKSLALAVLELCLSEGISLGISKQASKKVSQSVSQSVEKICQVQNFLKFHNYLMEGL